MIQLIKSANEIVDYENVVRKNKKTYYSDTIYTYDIEVTTLFEMDGKFKAFDFTKDKKFYQDVRKVSLPYVSQFSIDDDVYCFRDFYLFIDILQKISDEKVTKIIWVHNLSYEFQFLLNLINKQGWTIDKYIARGKRKIIFFTLREINIEFRCTYALTNLSLYNASIEYQCENQKQIGKLDYNIARSPLTILTDDNLLYCEFDLRVMIDFLRYFKNEYKHLFNIPYTQTGELRRMLKDKYVDYYYISKRQDSVPEAGIYTSLMSAFWGGVTHANYIHVEEVKQNVKSVDYSSSYPLRLCTEKYATGRWFEISENEIASYADVCCIIYSVRLYNIKSRLLNHYIPFSKSTHVKKARFDNGRIISAEYLELVITDIDFDIIRKSYNIETIEYEFIYASFKKYLEKEVIEAILDLYNEKTKLKNVEEMIFSYNKSKQRINACFGCACTNILKQNICFDIEAKNDEHKIWTANKLTLDFINSKIYEARKSYNTLFDYSTGVWCTAYARQGLWDLISNIDRDSVYYDTDSDKILNFDSHVEVIENINRQTFNKIKAVCEYHDIDIKRFSPCDIKGNTHTLGMLEQDGEYNEFITLGAKKYAFREKKDNSLHITVSGVKKDAVELLDNDIENFRDGFIFGYEAGKLGLIYNDNQEAFTFEDCDGNIYTCTDIKYTIIAVPTTYTLSISSDFRNTLDNIEEECYY